MTKRRKMTQNNRTWQDSGNEAEEAVARKLEELWGEEVLTQVTVGRNRKDGGGVRVDVCVPTRGVICEVKAGDYGQKLSHAANELSAYAAHLYTRGFPDMLWLVAVTGDRVWVRRTTNGFLLGYMEETTWGQLKDMVFRRELRAGETRFWESESWYMMPGLVRKQCKKCDFLYDEDDYNSDSSTRDGFARYCRYCASEQQQRWRADYVEKYPERIVAQRRRRNEARRQRWDAMSEEEKNEFNYRRRMTRRKKQGLVSLPV